MAEVVPIFPLDVVLLPGAPLPLHIFEPKYRQLVADVCVPGGPRAFGVVALQRGAELSVGAGARSVELASVGTLAEIIEVEPYPDGRSDLFTVGSRRFELLKVESAEKSYLCGQIAWLPENDGDLQPGHLSVARSLCERYSRVLAALSGREPEEDDLAADPLRLSYQLAARLRLQNADRQRLLEAETAALRLFAAMKLLRRETTMLLRTRTVPVSPHVLRVSPTVN